MKKWHKYIVQVLQVALFTLSFLLLFGCKSKEKVKSVKNTHEQVNEQSKINVDSNIDFKEAVRTQKAEQSSKNKNAEVVSVDSSSTMKLTPINPNKPSSATVNGKKYKWINAALNLSNQRSELKSRLNKTVNQQDTDSALKITEVQATVNKNVDKKSNKKTDVQSKQKEKHKEGGTAIWVWLLLILGVIAALFYFKKKINFKNWWL